MLRLLIFATLVAFVAFISFASGVVFAVLSPGDDPNKLVIPLLSMLSGWVSGLGTFIAAAAALYIAHQQSTDARKQDAIRCIYHAMALVNDLSSRVSYFETTVLNGGRPLVALTKNVETIVRRYEALFDRDLYKHLPGNVVDQITGMSGSVFGLETWTIAQSALLGDKPNFILPKRTPSEDALNPCTRLLKDLDALFTELQKLAGNALQ
jgi:hypothetical protein